MRPETPIASTLPAAATPAPSAAVLERNLRALTRTSKALVGMIRLTPPRTDVQFMATDDGVPTLLLGTPGTQMASRRRPLEEADKLAKTVPIETVPGVVVMGFGAGYHVAALARRMQRTGVIFAFEPDLGLLRAVLERIDFSKIFEESNVAILHDPRDAAAMSNLTLGVEGLLALGVKILDHPPSRQRLGDTRDVMGQTVASVMRTLRTGIVTTLVQTDITLRNLLQNLDHYTTAGGVQDLKDIAKGRAAIVVSAGPSLKRTIEVLAQPGVRDRCVIIAVQTVLKQLLARGIKPHFVTALDYSEISRRFYEGLTAQDVEGITLVCEAKANPAILDAFPGVIRCCADGWLDTLLGDDFTRPMGTLPAGATVAHLAYYLARHIGCDPVILTGQDLGFTDGQYYGSGAAIHDIWAAELGEFRTLEMLELERILRFGAMLSKREDVFGRSIFIDEQMSSYLMQFERDFKLDAEKGLTVIDATEGGTRKAHARIATLKDAITDFGNSIAPQPAFTLNTSKPIDRDQLKRHIIRVREDCLRIASWSRQSRELLTEAIERQQDQTRVNQIITRLYDLRDRVTALKVGYAMTHILNQAGTLRRFRQDRATAMAEGLTGLERQRRELERDQSNVEWIGDAAEHMASLLGECVNALSGKPKITRDPPPSAETYRSAGLDDPRAIERKVFAVVATDCSMGGLGTPRDLAAPFGPYRSLLRATIERLREVRQLDGILILSDDPHRAAELSGLPESDTLRYARVDATLMRSRIESLRASRLWARSSWRGGLASLTAWDEVLHPALLVPFIRELGINAVVPVGADWALVDPALMNAVITCYRDRPDNNRLTFAPAAAGIGSCLLDSGIVLEMADATQGAGVFASIGGMLGFVPVAPQLDPLGRNACVRVSPAQRDLGLRCIVDDEHARVLFERVAHLDGDALASAMTGRFNTADVPIDVTVEIAAPSGLIDTVLVERALRELGNLAPNPVLTIAAAAESDPMEHPAVLHMLTTAQDTGFAGTHLRTSVRQPQRDIGILETCGASVISFTLPSGPGMHDQAVRSLLASRGKGAAGLPTQWLVPRILRCDANYEAIDEFYQSWLMDAGACVIDPLPKTNAGERITPLDLPLLTRTMRAHTHVRIHADASVHAFDVSGVLRELGSLKTAGIVELWRAHVASLRTRTSLPAAGTLRAAS